MEELLTFLANSISNGAVGHYVSKCLRQIDENLPQLLDGKPDINKAEEIIAEKRLELDIARLSAEVKSKIESAKNANVINFSGGHNEGIIANSVEIKTLKKNVKFAPPSGSISSSLHHRNYVKYLIDRYHEFKKAETGKGGMRYEIFYQSIKRKFGAKWDMIPLENFDAVVKYIQKRIDNTILGRSQKSKNVKRCSMYDEYLAKSPEK